MSYERNYNEKGYNHDQDHGVESNNNNNNNNASNDNIEMNNEDRWRLRTLYVDTKHIYTAKTDEILTCDKLFAYQNRPQTHPSSLPVILKDSLRPYTYYTAKSYGDAQDNNYYVNFDEHVSGTPAVPGQHYNNYSNYSNNATASETAETMFENEYGTKMSVDDSTCAKTYLCSLLGCFVCCLFQMKPV
jgi:hypothetical protein